MSFPVEPIAPLEAARLFIEKISNPARILVAVSGGSDSTGLLLALHRALTEMSRREISLHAVTIDHALRSGSSDEARGVAALCARHDIPHHIRRWDGEKPATGISAAARLARYDLIGEVVADIGADVIALGHTLGDQQETIAMRVARSERPDNLGLAGMADAVLYAGRHWIVRPLLSSTREDIRNFLSGQGQSWYDDPSNEDAKYERVRMRNLLPEPQGKLIDRSINRSALSSSSAQWLGQQAESYLDCLIKINAAGLQHDATILRYALSALASVIGGRRFAMAADSMDRVLAFVTKGEPGRVTASRVVFDLRKDALYLTRENRGIPSLAVAAGATALWDERFEITNRSTRTLMIGGRGARMAVDLPSSIPKGVAKRVMQTRPATEVEGDQSPALEAGDVVIRPLLAPYDLFLPRFDLELANVIARLIGRSPYPQPPV
ncbi:tRNA lysidine(34) synthetase TilS [Agrobacterium rosae]|uniref:tRNA(Ile)-lysidine synthase n=1 Tax=Agrobacterium rosae TaxID=1972867 RepID=A0AAE5S1A2_9HYPH|nr:tRNA lysidine(34) synthetase TilS [Agrobacterium rosae]KAA3521684.1 tRNA lysidine(34) synthetase TilS [Agrobacterium rosae]MCM2432748.1 tRNA lysidine(34) synthetase TilS [Agrobacterium rosae]MQB48297.1 tRNA lysidine(34) synthetase TilS [Agrobacterium rosae]POO53734.1 tRNA lysidine(34) synthetase TilS [Agrobacterium rosae]